MTGETAPPGQKKGALNARFFVGDPPPMAPLPAPAPHETVNIQSTYFEEIGNIPLLSSDQERSMLQTMHKDKPFQDHLLHLRELEKARETNGKLLELTDHCLQQNKTYPMRFYQHGLQCIRLQEDGFLGS